MKDYRRGIARLLTEGEVPPMTGFDVLLARPKGRTNLRKLLADAQADGSLATLELLPGPWRAASTEDEKLALIKRVISADMEGSLIQLHAEFQMQYGDRGLGSNIAVPVVTAHGEDSMMAGRPPPKEGHVQEQVRLVARVLVADPADAERISRTHVRKEPNFGPFLDSVISTTDNEHWREQRQHLAEAFLPLSSLAQIMPVSLARAKMCADRLAGLAADNPVVDISDFLLHEAQAQLQLALLGGNEDLMERSNADIRRTFMLHPEAKVGRLGETMSEILTLARESRNMALPTDGCPVQGPLSRALQVGDFKASTDYGNMMLILFAGHDTTGHTMTWLMFELARHPEFQRRLQLEADRFFADLGGRDPTYADLSRLTFLDRCVTETLRLWPAVANGTFRQLQFPDHVSGPGGEPVMLPRGTLVNINNWSRHRNPNVWGPDADTFNPDREFKDGEVARVGCPMAATTPQSERFSPFAHNPRSCLGKNFAQMEMRLILPHLLHRFDFSLAPPYSAYQDVSIPTCPVPRGHLRGVNRGTMGPLDLERGGSVSPGEGPLIAMKLFVQPRTRV